LVLLSLFVLAMIAFRAWWYVGGPQQGGIAWNLFLAWIPFVLALVVYARSDGAFFSGPVLAAISLLWLVFLPNAPYLVTDLKYVGSDSGVPVLYDVVLLTAAAWAGLLLGLVSLFLMHMVWQRVLGVLNAWAVVVVALALSSFGIYLGRIQRWNSWDVFTRPLSLTGQIAQGLLDPISHPRPVGLTVLFTVFLFASYLVFYAFARLNYSATK
jgi:uncharacterized membrane protein